MTGKFLDHVTGPVLRAFNDFGVRLEEARLAKGLICMELAVMSGVSRHSINSYEAGKNGPTLLTTLRLADSLGVKVGWLAAGEGTRE